MEDYCSFGVAVSQQLTFNLEVDNSAAVSSINTFFDAFDAGVKNAGQILDKQFKEKGKVIALRLEGGKVVAKEIENINTISSKAKKATKALNGEYGKTPKAVQRSINILKTLISTTKKYKDGTKEVTADWKILIKRLREAKEVMKGMRIDPQMEKSITGANIAAGLALDAIRALGRAVVGFIKEGVQMEVLMLQLEGFTGGTEQATEAFQEFVRIAVNTPFNVKQVTEAARTMMGFGVSTDEATSRVEQLAIIAASTDGDLKQMARNLGQIQANQKAYTRDLMQFANQGIPIYDMLGKVLGESTENIRQFATEGTIGYSEVTAALDLMTEKGSAYQVIAEKMGRTISARMEEMGSAVTTASGQFISMIQSMDSALGGPIEKAMQAVATVIRSVGDAMQWIGDNATKLRPIIVGIGTAMALALGIATVQNIIAIKGAIGGLIMTVLNYRAVMVSLVVIEKILAALRGNWLGLAAAAAVAAAATVYFTKDQDSATSSTKEFNAALAKEKTLVLENADAGKLLAFQTKEVTGETKKLIIEQRKKFKAAQQGYKMQISAMDRTLGYLKKIAEQDKANHEKVIEQQKKEIETEKENMRVALDAAKRSHEEKMTGLKAELQAVIERYDTELGYLDEETVYAAELRQIRKQEIQAKLQSTELSRKEKLELLEQLEQMKRQEQRKILLKKKAEEVKAVEEKITQEQEKQKTKIEEIEKKYGNRIKVAEQVIKAEAEAIDKIDAKLEEQAAKIKQFKADEVTAIFENRDAAIQALDDQITKAADLRDAMREAYNQARLANQEAAKAKAGPSGIRASGGPVTGGSSYQVNELGKEAFLSASGKLSMINAPSFGTWKAPSAGTVIPAHLTSQLNVPKGGVNINKAGGASAGAGGGMNMRGMVRAITGALGGDTVNNSVTIQSTNPTQSANSMMVQLQRLRRGRYGR